MRSGRLRGMCVSVVVSAAALALAVAPVCASGASPVLEFVAPGTAFPIGFTANGGAVTAELAGFDSVVHCSDSVGDGVLTGPRSAISNYFFTGCVAQGGAHSDQECVSAGADPEEITAEAIAADLVYIDQAKHEVGMLLNPDEGVYMTFECGGEEVEASGPFLSPVGPINVEATSFTATLSRSGAAQTPNEYENALGEKRPAIPMGKRESDPTPHTTGVELSYTIHTEAPLQIKAVTGAEIEARQREDEAAAAAAAKKRQEEEAATKKRQEDEAAALAAKKRQEDEAAALAAKKHRQKAKARARKRHLAKAIRHCKKVKPGKKRVRCVKRAHGRYRAHKGSGNAARTSST